MPDVELKQLRDLLALAGTSSLFRAAESRNITHPAFGRRIRMLESWAGVPLVERGRARSRLTPEGRTLAAAAREVFELLDETRSSIRRSDPARLRRVVVAAGRTLSHTVLPRLVDDLARQVPDLSWCVKTTSLSFGLQMLGDAEADLLLCHVERTGVPDARVDSCRVGQDALVAVSVPLVSDHPRFRVPSGETDIQVPYLAYADGMSLGRVLQGHLGRLCPADGLRRVYESDLAEAIHAMTLRGAGLAWLPESLIREDLQRGRLVRANRPGDDLPLDILLCRRTGSPAKRHLDRVWRAVLGLAQADGGT